MEIFSFFPDMLYKALVLGGDLWKRVPWTNKLENVSLW